MSGFLSERIEILNITAKNGEKNAVLCKDGRKIYMHSNYDPTRNAKVFVSGYKMKYSSIVVLFGTGLGYELKELMKIAYAGVKILVIEPILGIIEETIKNADMIEEMEITNIHLLASVNGKEIEAFLNRYIDRYNFIDVDILALPSYKEMFTDKYNLLLNIVKKVKLGHEIYARTYSSQGVIWQNNIISNLKHIQNSVKIREFCNKFMNIPTIIVSAGPSLNKNIHTLKQASETGKFIIIAAYKALSVLQKNNIIPDLIVSVDGHQTAWENGDKPDITVPLLYIPASDSKLLNRHKGTKIVGLTKQFEEHSPLFQSIYEADSFLFTGGSVVVSAVDFAQMAGCNPIIFVGQDLAFTGGMTHADGVEHKKHITIDSAKAPLFEVEDVSGGVVLTDITLDGYRKILESYIDAETRITGRIYIDATEGGALIKGTKIMSLKSVVEEYKNNKPCVINDINKIFDKSKKLGTVLSNQKIKEFVECFKTNIIEIIELWNNELTSAAAEYGNFSFQTNRKREEMKELTEVIENVLSTTIKPSHHASILFECVCMQWIHWVYINNYENWFYGTEMQTEVFNNMYYMRYYTFVGGFFVKRLNYLLKELSFLGDIEFS